MDCQFTRSCEDSIRRAPLASIGLTAAGAFVVSKLPLGAIVGALLRLALALVRPALLVLGVLKIAQLCRKSSELDPVAGGEPSPISEAIS